MLTREQSLDRVEQLREMVSEIPASGFSPDSWVTDYDPLTGCGPTDGTVVYAPEQWKEWTGHDIGYHSDGWDDKAMQPFTGTVILEHDAAL